MSAPNSRSTFAQLCRRIGIPTEAIDLVNWRNTVGGTTWTDPQQLPAGAKATPHDKGPESSKKAWKCRKEHAHGHMYIAGNLKYCCSCNNSRTSDCVEAPFYLKKGEARLLYMRNTEWKPKKLKKVQYDLTKTLHRRWPDHSASAVYFAFIELLGLPENIARERVQAQVFQVKDYNITWIYGSHPSNSDCDSVTICGDEDNAEENDEDEDEVDRNYKNNEDNEDNEDDEDDGDSGDDGDDGDDDDYIDDSETEGSQSRDNVSIDRRPNLTAAAPSNFQDYMRPAHIYPDQTESGDFSFTLIFRLYIPSIIRHVHYLLPYHQTTLKEQGWRTTALALTQNMLERDWPFDDYLVQHKIETHYITNAISTQFAWANKGQVSALPHFLSIINAALLGRNQRLFQVACDKNDEDTIDILKNRPGKPTYGRADLQDRLRCSWMESRYLNPSFTLPPFMEHAEFEEKWEIRMEGNTMIMPELERQWESGRELIYTGVMTTLSERSSDVFAHELFSDCALSAMGQRIQAIENERQVRHNQKKVCKETRDDETVTMEPVVSQFFDYVFQRLPGCELSDSTDTNIFDMLFDKAKTTVAWRCPNTHPWGVIVVSGKSPTCPLCGYDRASMQANSSTQGIGHYDGFEVSADIKEGYVCITQETDWVPEAEWDHNQEMAPRYQLASGFYFELKKLGVSHDMALQHARIPFRVLTTGSNNTAFQGRGIGKFHPLVTQATFSIFCKLQPYQRALYKHLARIFTQLKVQGMYMQNEDLFVLYLQAFQRLDPSTAMSGGLDGQLRRSTLLSLRTVSEEFPFSRSAFMLQKALWWRYEHHPEWYGEDIVALIKTRVPDTEAEHEHPITEEYWKSMMPKDNAVYV